MFFAICLLAAGIAAGQRRGRIPSVAQLIESHDKDGDGKISKQESDGSAQAKRQFDRWDADKDGFASREEIIALRKKAGIDAEGRRVHGPGKDPGPPAKLTIPAIDEITRTDGRTRPSPEDRQFSLSIVKTETHAVSDSGYVVLTDHTERAWLKHLRRLATHHDGTLIQVDDLATIHMDKKQWEKLHGDLKQATPRYVAIAPRLENYREKMLLGMWKLLSTLDDDPQLDVFPGLLVAPDADSFKNLISKSINHEPQSGDNFQPLAQCHFTGTSAGGIKSLQKVGILRRHFATLGHDTSSLIVAAPKVRDERPLKGDKIIYASPEQRLLQTFHDDAREALNNSSLIVMFGHGSPGMSCGFSVDAFHDLDLTGKVVMAGSCWSAAPIKLDFPMPRRDAAGTQLEDGKERFLMRAVENGALVSFGHMRLNKGFSHLYPVLESWLEGKTVGEGYQQLMNALFKMQTRTSLDDVLALDPDTSKPGSEERRSPAIPGNVFLYVIIGDPALQPFEKLTPIATGRDEKQDSR